MPIDFPLTESLKEFPATIGVVPSDLSRNFITKIPHNPHDNIILRDIEFGDFKEEVKILKHTENGRTVLTSTVCLKSTANAQGIEMEQLPRLLAAINSQIKHDENIVALQFPISFGVSGAISGKGYRSHFNQLLIYKTPCGGVNAVIIDSANNPIGVVNPAKDVPLIGWMFTSSVVSGSELLNSKIERLLISQESAVSLLPLFKIDGYDADTPAAYTTVSYPIFTGVQASIPSISVGFEDDSWVPSPKVGDSDKRCGIYVCMAMTGLINYFHATSNTGGDIVTPPRISDVVTRAHNAVASIPLSGPVETAASKPTHLLVTH